MIFKKIKPFVVLIFLAAVLLIALAAVRFLTRADNYATSYEADVQILNEREPSDIIVLGDIVGFGPSLHFRTIPAITEENLKSDPRYSYSFLVINDRSGKVNLTDEQMEICKKFCDTENLSLYYIGTQYLAALRDAGFYAGEYPKDCCSVCYVRSPLGSSNIYWLWTQTEEEHCRQNPNLLGELLVYSFVDHVIGSMNRAAQTAPDSGTATDFI